MHSYERFSVTRRSLLYEWDESVANVVTQAKIDRDWLIKKTLLALVASVIPFGTFWADMKLFWEQ